MKFILFLCVFMLGCQSPAEKQIEIVREQQDAKAIYEHHKFVIESHGFKEVSIMTGGSFFNCPYSPNLYWDQYPFSGKASNGTIMTGAICCIPSTGKCVVFF